MKQRNRLLLSLVSSLVATPLTLAGLLRLGWRRHSAGPADPRFLHLDWVVQPSLPFWSAHLGNLGMLLTGLIFLSVAAISLGQLVVCRRRAAREK